MNEHYPKHWTPISIIRSLIHIGVTDELELFYHFVVKYINALAIAGIVVPLTSMMLEEFLFDTRWIPHSGFFIISIVVFYFHSIRQYDGAKFVMILLPPTVQTLNLFFLNTSPGLELTIIPFVIIVPFVINSIRLRVITMVYVLALLIACIWKLEYVMNKEFVFNAVAVTLGIAIGIYIMVQHLQTSASALRDKNALLQEQNNELGQLVNQNKLKTELLSILSHDLRGPASSYNMLSSKVAYLLRNQEYDTLMAMADSFEDSSQQLFKNIDYLLNWTLSQKDEIKAHFSPVRIRELVENMTPYFEHSLLKKNVRVDIRIDPNIVLFSDAHMLTIILKNLIDNAIQFSPDESHVIVGYKKMGDEDCLYIKDEGIGIDPQIVEQLRIGVFEKSKAGHGLGLKISMNLVAILKGSISFVRGDVRGTTAMLVLPQKEVADLNKSEDEGVVFDVVEKGDILREVELEKKSIEDV